MKSSVSCQACRTNLTKEARNDLYMFCYLGCGRDLNFALITSVADHLRQVHTAYCEPVSDHIGCDENCNLALNAGKQAHDDKANDTDDATTGNTDAKKVKDPALEPQVAGRKRLNCELCDKQFHQRTELEKHMSSLHGENTMSKPVACEYCGKRFRKKTDLKKHVSATHDFSCECCGKHFRKRTDINKHM